MNSKDKNMFDECNKGCKILCAGKILQLSFQTPNKEEKVLCSI